MRGFGADPAEILESITDAFFALDDGWRFAYLNREAESVLFRKREELLGKNVWEEFPEAVGLGFHREYYRAVSERVTVEFEEYYPPLKAWFEVRAYPSKFGLSVYFRDVNERKKAEEALRESEERLRSLVRNALDIITVVGADGTITYESPSVGRVLGYRSEEKVGTNALDYVHPEDLERIRRSLADGLKTTGTTGKRFEFRSRHKDGSWRWLEAVGSNLLSDPGVRGIVVNARDVTERKEAEEGKLRVSREYEEMIRVLPNVVFRCGRAGDGGMRLTYSEGALAREFGVDTARAAGRTLEELFPPEFLSTVVPAFKRAFAGETVEFPSRIGERSFANVAKPLRAASNGGKRGREGGRAPADEIVGYVTEVTERVRAEEALRESERRFRSVLRYSSDVVMILDGDGTIRYQSQAVERLLGYRPEELVGESSFDYLHPEDAGRASKELRRVLENPGLHEPVQYRFRHKDGSWRWFEGIGNNLLSDPAVGGIVVNSRDVTERKRAEEALRLSEERFRYMVQNSSDIITLVGADGTIRYSSPALERVLGYAPEERVGGNIFDLLHPDDAERTRERFAEGLKNPGLPLNIEVRQRHKDGSWRVVEVTGTNLLSDPGAGAVVLNSRDVTERKRAEEAVRESERRFRQLFENSADALLVVHPETREVVDCNREACRSLGYAREELLGLRLEDFALEVLSEEEKRRRGPDAPWRRALSGEPGTIIGFHENVHRRKDGTTFPVEVGVGSIDYAGRRMILASCRDATERKRAEEALRLRDRAIAESKDGVVITGPGEQDHPMVYVNRGFERMTGYAAEELLGRNCRMMQGSEREQPALKGLRAALREGREWSGILRNHRKDGTPFWNELSISPVHDETGSVTHFVGVMNDATERKELEERLAHQAFRDPLTGLPNRVLLADRLGHALARAERERNRVAVLFVDLDNFKYVNDSLGHEAGDGLLVAVAERLLAVLRPADTAARLGGDEFAVLLEGVGEDGREAERVAGRIVEGLREPFVLSGQEVFVTPSIGIATGGGPAGGASEDLLRRADLAMYEAKRGGKARYEVFDPETERRSMRRLRLENELRRAIERDELVVRYQPVVRLSTGRIAGFEALLRWEHPGRGLVLPNEFVPLAEETGLIVPIGLRVLGEACRQAKAWRKRHPGSADPPLVVGVNLSPRQLSHPGLVGDVRTALEESGLEPARLTLEITEGAVVEDGERSAATLRGLEDLGVRLALDDFGTGYSSLSYLRRLPVGMLKIDRSFVERLGQDPEDEVLLEGVVGIAHGLGLLVCAEGVETAGQLARAKTLGCDLAQGNLFSAPLTGKEAAAFLAGDPEGNPAPRG